MKARLFALLLLTTAPLASTHALDKAFTPDGNTLSLWVFDAGSGEKIVNKTDQGVVGEFDGELKWVKDEVGVGLAFDGDDAQLNVVKGKDLNIEANAPFSIDILFRVPKDATQVGSLYWSRPSVQIEFRNAVFTIWSCFKDWTANAYIELKGRMPVNDGLPHRLTIVRDPAKEKLTQYIDGKLDSETPCPKTAAFKIPLAAAIGGEILKQPNYDRRSENFQGVIYAIHFSKALIIGK